MRVHARKLALALTLASLLCLIVSASAFATPEMTVSSYPATITGSNTKGSEVITTEGGKVECNSHFVGSVSASTSTTILDPTYTNCQAFGFLEATVTTNHCHEYFHHTQKLSSGVYKSHIDIVCTPTPPPVPPPSYKIAAATCEIEIKGQTGLGNVKTTNLAGGTITMQHEVEKIAYTVTKDGFLCPFGGTGNKTDGKYTGDIVLSRAGGGTIDLGGE
jgi:hypothetical protein